MPEFTPTISIDSDGNEYVDYDSGQVNYRHQYHRGQTPTGFEVNEETGEHYIFEDDPDQEADFTDSYLQTLAEAEPNLPKAITYIKEYGDAEMIQILLDAAKDEDYDQLNALVETILDMYEDSDEYEPEEDDSDSIEELEDEVEDLEVPDISSLYEAEPDAELSDTFSDLATKSEGVAKLLYQLSARFHSDTGESADDLIEIALSSGYSRNELITAYNLLTDSNE